MTAARLKLLLILAGVAGGGLTLLSWTQPWFGLILDGGQPLEISGQAASPGLSALGLACLALAGALTIAGRVLRVVLGIVETLIGVVVVVTAASVLASPVSASASAITAATAVSGSKSIVDVVLSISISGWPWLAIAAGALITVVGIMVIALAPRWPGPTRRYDTNGVAVTDDTTTALDAWDSLTGGSDPTIR